MDKKVMKRHVLCPKEYKKGAKDMPLDLTIYTLLYIR